MKIPFVTASLLLVIGSSVHAMAQSNTSTVEQLGFYNGIGVQQIGASAINDSIIHQGLGKYGSAFNKANVYQDGVNVQRNESIITQDGISNYASATQGGDSLIGDQNISTINQDGQGNNATLVQGNAFHDNNSEITQFGAGNYANVYQKSSAMSENIENKSAVTQIGVGNRVDVYQGGNFAHNDSEISQSDALGGFNYAYVAQGGSSNNESDVMQHGSLNQTSITQNSALGVDNTSTVTQTGIGNEARVWQH